MSSADPLGLRDHRNPKNWALTCELCGQAWPSAMTIGEVRKHFEEQHPGRGLRFRTTWVGEGKAPRRIPRLRTDEEGRA